MSMQLSSAASALVVPTQFPSIQAAINAASSGNTIKVLPGTYTEQVSINKNLILTGSGAKSTIIKAPSALRTGVLGIPFIVELQNGAKVIMKGFTISGVSGTDCGTTPAEGLIGISIQEEAAINLDSAIIRDCTVVAFRIGAPFFFDKGPQIGHAIITKTDIIDYRGVGIIAATSGSTLSVSQSKIVAGKNSDISGQIGIASVLGAKATIERNKISGNLCNNPDCGPDFINQIQGFGIGPTFAGPAQ